MLELITGGSSSGKSRYAEDEIMKLGDGKRIYIATMNAHDPESIERIKRHRKMREDKNFETIECFTRLFDLELPEHCNVLVEDMANLLANEMFMPYAAGIHAVNAVIEGIEHLVEISDNVVIVTNEIFSDGVEYGTQTRMFMEYLGLINQHLGKTADKLTEIVVGVPVIVKDLTGRD